jgi:DNA repair protein SbcD/Mre11
MRILHTSDWHLGRTLAQEGLLDDQAHLLDQVYAAVADNKVQALVIAGDIFDRPAPRKEAVALFSDFLARIYADTDAAIIAIAGNHDAPERISFNSALQDPRRVLIRGPLLDRATPLVLEDAHGKVAFSALPFSEVFIAREAFGDVAIATPAHVLAAQVAEARRHVPADARWVIAAHAFVEGGKVTETERSLAQVGGIETVPAGVFEGAAYVALGHLHRAQHAGAPHVRYSGSWMGFGFDEADEIKSMTLVELDGAGAVSVRELPLSSKRPLRVITGRLAELLHIGRTAEASGNSELIKAVLTDEGALVDAIGQLRAVYPNLLQLERQQRIGIIAPGVIAGAIAAVDRSDPRKMISRFLDGVRGEGPNDVETAAIGDVLAELEIEEA